VRADDLVKVELFPRIQTRVYVSAKRIVLTSAKKIVSGRWSKGELSMERDKTTVVD
jgi:hypothetical protein